MLSKTLRYAYFPGCVAQGACRELYLSTAALTQALGIELIELKKAACCGSGTFKEDSQLLEDTVNARNIALAEDLHLPLLTHCSTCQGVIGHVDERLKELQVSDSGYVEQINGLLQKEGCSPYRGSTEVKHLLWALVTDYGLDALQERVTRKLAGLKCAICYALRSLSPMMTLTDRNQWKMCFEQLGQHPSITGGELSVVVGRLLVMQRPNLSRWLERIFRKHLTRVLIVW
jgi:succinate dehydrogenase / fumarate reductase cytochrome b subunit